MRRENPRLFRARDESRFLTLIFDIMTDDFLRCITIAKSLSVIWHSKPTGLQPVGSSPDIPFWERKEYCEKKYQEKCRIRRSGTYKKIPVDQIENVFTNFYDEFEKQLVFAKLFDSFRGKKEDQY